MKPLTPTEVNAVAAQTLEASPFLAETARAGVEGEVTNWKGASKSGHFFFSIRDAASELPVVCWSRRAATAFPRGMENGMKVVAYGKVSLWKVRGDFRLSIERMEEAGRGDLWAKVEATRKKLAEEGLLDPGRKRPLPPYPRRIGIATSETGVVIHDVSTVLSSRWPLATLVLRPVPVQGEGAGRAIAEGLVDLARRGRCDVILLCRGGGSAEDLMPFHDEVVARAIRYVSESCGVPVVTGIGHAPDHAIADDAADAFGPVPAKAAEVAAPDREELLRALSDDVDRAASAVHRRIDRAGLAIGEMARRLARGAPAVRIERNRSRLAAARAALAAGLSARHGRAAEALARAGQRLADLSPTSVLSRGYALVYDAHANRLLRRAREAAPGLRLRVRLAEGEIAARAEGGRAE